MASTRTCSQQPAPPARPRGVSYTALSVLPGIVPSMGKSVGSDMARAVLTMAFLFLYSETSSGMHVSMMAAQKLIQYTRSSSLELFLFFAGCMGHLKPAPDVGCLAQRLVDRRVRCAVGEQGARTACRSRRANHLLTVPLFVVRISIQTEPHPSQSHRQGINLGSRSHAGLSPLPVCLSPHSQSHAQVTGMR